MFSWTSEKVQKLIIIMVVIISAFVIAYMVYDQVEKEHKRLMRKNPADFENEE